MICKILASFACVYLQKQWDFEATQQVEKTCKDIILGDKANTISEVLDPQATAPFLTIWSIVREESFKVLKLFADLNQRWRMKELLSKDTIPHRLRFKFKLTLSKATKDLLESKALVEHAKNTF